MVDGRLVGGKHFHGDSLGLWYKGAIVECGILNYRKNMCLLCVSLLLGNCCYGSPGQSN